MILVDPERVTDPHLNLAMEEYLLRNFETDEDLLLLYINEPSIILGRYQNAWEEVNQEYVDAHKIHVVRRVSGGGTVYHDLGNLNFSMITQRAAENFHNFKKFTAPVIAVLQEMGVDAELNGRNDIVVGGRKISGNAQYIATRRMVSHGTLLFNSDLGSIGEALRANPGEFTSKSIKSVRSQVANIRDYLDEPMDVETFRQRLLGGIFGGSSEIPSHRLSRADWEAIRALARDRYQTYEWNYGSSPDFSLRRAQRFGFGEIVADIEIRRGQIYSIHFSGDFTRRGETSGLEARLAGVRYLRTDLSEALQGMGLDRYFQGLTQEAFLQFIC